MKVLSIATDRKIFEENSAVRQRVLEYGKIFDELHVIVFSRKAQNASQKIAENVFVYTTNSKSKLFYLIDAFKIARKLLASSDLRLGTVISTQDPFETGLVGLFLKLVYKLPLQVQIHTDFVNKYFITHSLLNFLRFPLSLFILSFADAIRCVSERVATSVHSLSHHISVLPIHVELKKEKVERLRNTKIKILTVCRLEREKDLETAIKAFKKVVLSGIVAEFTIVGDGGERGNLELLAKSLELGNKINFVGWQKNTENYYKEADVYLSTSLYEGYGMSLVEAASFGLPAVLSDAGVAGFVLKDKQEAFVCKQRDVSGFAKAMAELCFSYELRKKMGEMAREAVEKDQVSLDEYLRRYQSSMNDALIFSNAQHGVFKKNILLRYLVAGLTATFANLSFLYIFTDVLKIWYLYSSMLAFIAGISVSFVLQKFWTFGDGEMSTIHYQFVKYLSVAALGLSVNTLMMFILVNILDVWYILAQIITGGFVMVLNFLMYKFFIFHKE